ncbi:conserved Plasmodium protein, unknown function [Plasmodium gallinaceum]|uniref:Uncharacterized protein n=1 Tax=Plasmodium gallinaceum TaxID=5849 RepID=A0A1J1H309_PLAGA|nr:conserved Plasmodium protein, unknown function [Plasmodium gallinaceum]CRG97869.1 conserved Plasmodium protein, unknown function [Plasmodium gallinaceum]
MSERDGEIHKEYKEENILDDKEKEFRGNQNELNENDTKNKSDRTYIDPKMYNKFKNDGSFLEQVLALQKEKKVRKSKTSENSEPKKKKTKKKDVEEKKEKSLDSNVKDEQDDVEDERETQIKNEYIEKINKMKEQGFFTDKGIGAGLVK